MFHQLSASDLRLSACNALHCNNIPEKIRENKKRASCERGVF